MSRNAIIAIFIAIVMAVPTTVVCADIVLTPNTYTIEYELDGGHNSELNPSSVRDGDTVSLKCPYHDTMVFDGWFTDPELTNRITEISPKENVKLYAGWSDTLVGRGYVLAYTEKTTISGFMFSHVYTTEGTYERRYVAYDETKGYLLEDIRTVDGKSTTYVRWTGESDDEWTVDPQIHEINTANGSRFCEVITTSSAYGYESQYTGDFYIPYLIKSQYTYGFETYYTEYNYVNSIFFESSGEYEIKAYADDGISVKGDGEYKLGENAVLNAAVQEGYEFAGWYDSTGTLLSYDLEYEIGTVYSNLTVYALNKKSTDLSVNAGVECKIEPSLPLTETVWTISDEEESITSDVLNYAFDVGTHTVTYVGKESDGTTHYGFFTVLADGIVVKEFNWVHNSNNYDYSMSILYSDYLEYYNDDISRRTGSVEHDRSFVTSNDKYITKIATDFAKMTEGMSDKDIVNFILCFTQYIEYQSDEVYMGVGEYWKYPLETLFDQGGDCEDTSILYCAIASAMGYDSTLLLFYGHMMAAVAAEGCSGDGVTFTADNVSMYFCETTAAGYDVGECPDIKSYNWSTVVSAIRIAPVIAEV